MEVAPGYEPKIGNALAMFGFNGTVFLIEPDQKAAEHIQKTYQRILPKATINAIIKPLQEIKTGVDVPCDANVLIASHPFDDMVMSFVANRAYLFSEERKSMTETPDSIKNIYDSLTHEHYAYGIRETVKTWRQFIAESSPAYFIASQYPSRTLETKKLIDRQNSGFVVLDELKDLYRESLRKFNLGNAFGYKANPRWWIVAEKPQKNLGSSLEQKPFAIKRLGESIFASQKTKMLNSSQYEIVYIDERYFKNSGYGDVSKQAKSFAIVLDHNKTQSSKLLITYADRQKDKTDVGLCGNLGSGRAVYYGDRFNVLGVGRTTLCKSAVPSHSTGKAELIGCMRRVILSKWINYFTKRAVEHPLLIALKETAKFKWNPNPVPLAMAVRVDNEDLDRPSHVEYRPGIVLNFTKILTEYAKLDAEFFAYRIMLGAWSTSNYSLDGKLIDLESASFVKYRAPYYTSSSRYPHNRFGYEGLGFLKILHQLADVKNIDNAGIDSLFYKERRKHLGLCFLYLLGVAAEPARNFFLRRENYVTTLSNQFEKLSKKISPQKTDLNLYRPIVESEDPALFDMSNLFRNLAKIYKSSSVEKRGGDYLIRKTTAAHLNAGEANNALKEAASFVRAIFELISVLRSEKCLGNESDWDRRLTATNQDLPNMFELNEKLRYLAEEYRLGKMNAVALESEINKLIAYPTELQK